MSVGEDFGDDDDDAAPGPALDLDLDIGATRAKPEQEALGHTVGDGFDEDEEEAGAGVLDLHPENPAGAVVAKPGAPAATPTVEIDPFEIRALADYGPEPKGIVQAVPYALRVVRRQRELKRALENVRTQLKEAETRRDERLIELGTLLKPILLSNPEYAGIASSLGSAEKVVAERADALAQTNTAFRDRAAAIDAEIAGMEPTLTAARAVVETRNQAFEDADQLRKKHEARRKRVEIDVRGAQAKLAALETLPPDRTAAQSLVAAAGQERETRAAEERLATTAAQAAEAEVATARGQLQQLEARVEALRKKRRLLEQEFSRQGAVRSEGVDAASKDVRNVLLDVGRKTWQAGPDVEGAAMRRKGVTDADAVVKRLQIDMEKHVRALGSADRNAVRNGLIVLAAVVVLLVGSFIAWRALRSNPYMDQQPPKTSALVVPRSHA